MDSDIKAKDKTDTADEQENSGSVSLMVFGWLDTLIPAIAIIGLIMTFFFRTVTVSGTSMTDTLQNNDKLILSTFNYNPQYGDIVVVSHANSYSEPLIKRIIATEGQSLKINYSTGEVAVDGVILDEEYIKGTTIRLRNPMNIPEIIPEGYVFVMGDNREGSLDSRSNEIGLIPVENIIGKAVFRFYPLEKSGIVQ